MDLTANWNIQRLSVSHACFKQSVNRKMLTHVLQNDQIVGTEISANYFNMWNLASGPGIRRC